MEVEIKVKIDKIENFEKIIKEIGGTFIKEVIEIDEYFNHPCRNFAETDEAIRIRNDRTLTYKGPKVDRKTKSREEINITIDNIEKTRKLLIFLGFKPVAKVIKKRKYYKLDELIISLDDVERLGYFMEIECIGEYNPCKEKVLNLAKLLELENFITKSYLEMILEKNVI